MNSHLKDAPVTQSTLHPPESRPEAHSGESVLSDPNTHGAPAIPRWKRLLDLTLIVLALAVLVPLCGVIALWIRLASRGRVLYRQERMGYRGKPFTMYKFRSMKEGASTDGHKEHVRELVRSGRPMTKLDANGDERRILGGGILRNTGLDELPQLLNVLRGEMSLVGPRPCVLEEYDYYTIAQRERFEAAPGLTGYWQISGKNRTTFAEMVSLDVHYIRNRSLLLDLGILAKTPWVLLRQVVADDRPDPTPPDHPPGGRLRASSQLSD